MSPRLRKFALTAHIGSSVAWIGAVAGFLALAVAGLASQDAPMARAAYVGMERIARFVIVPLAFAALLTAAWCWLLVPLALSVYKPWGLTPYGRRKQAGQRPAPPG